ncbi:unnamed protein product [Scytosiphon promiscuus]
MPAGLIVSTAVTRKIVRNVEVRGEAVGEERDAGFDLTEHINRLKKNVSKAWWLVCLVSSAYEIAVVGQMARGACVTPTILHRADIARRWALSVSMRFSSVLQQFRKTTLNTHLAELNSELNAGSPLCDLPFCAVHV